MVLKEYHSPVGLLYLAAIGSELSLCGWQDTAVCHPYLCGDKGGGCNARECAVIENARNELDEYFGGIRRVFDVPLGMQGTEFQKLVWRTLAGIPYGVTVSYGDLARSIGRPLAVRAVANACKRNPLSIFIPCHRVVGSSGRLTGYAGGIDVKQRLLSLEGSGIQAVL